jgi:hypothetical protein
MNRAQKIAWFNLTVMVAGVALVMVMAAIKVIELAIVILLGIGGLVGISPVLFWKKGKINFDERDELISERGILMASVITCSYFAVTCLMPLITVGPKGSVPVNELIGIVIGAFICFVTSKSVITLLAYGRGNKNVQM